MENINFVAGGKTGDLLHTFFAVKKICEKENKKANIFITNETKYGGDIFHFPIEKTLDDLRPFFEYQSVVETFDSLPNNLSKFINLNSWRSYFLFGSTNWIRLLSPLYGVDEKTDNWLSFDKDDNYRDYIIIHRSLQRHSEKFPWEKIVRENNCLFVSTDSREIENFKHNKYVDYLFCEDFSQLALVINSGKFFVGNMSTPLALAHGLGVPRLGELFKYDEVFYMGEEDFLKNYYYITDKNKNHLEGISNFIEI
jgi:hypothetical protein